MITYSFKDNPFFNGNINKINQLIKFVKHLRNLRIILFIHGLIQTVNSHHLKNMGLTFSNFS